MTLAISPRRLAMAALSAAMALMLAGCLLTPGKFNSTLDLRKNGRFTFTYVGEMHLIPLTKLAEQGRSGGSEPVFEPAPCETDAGEPRECSTAEIDRQMRDWQAEQKDRASREKQEAEQMAAMMGGIDPSDPKAAAELAASLRRQKGWKRVDYRGDGLFDVDFALTGSLDHDFVFPMMESLPMANGFVRLAMRKDNSVRIDAPAFSAAANPYAGMMQMAMADEGRKKDMAAPPRMDGTFTIVTDGAILANNTEEGPASSTTGQTLVWKVSERTQSPPTALIRLSE